MERYDVVRVRCTHLLEDKYMLFEEGREYEFEKFQEGRNKAYVYRVKTKLQSFLVKFCNKSYLRHLVEYGFYDYYIFDDYFVEVKRK